MDVAGNMVYSISTELLVFPAFSFFFLKMYVFERASVRARKRHIFQVLIYSPKGYSSQGWAKPKSGCWN